MSNSRYYKFRTFFKVLFVSLVAGLLFYGTSCNKGSSSFAARKYTKGRFIDRVEKLKMQYLPYKNDLSIAKGKSSVSDKPATDNYSPSTTPSSVVQDTITNNSDNESGKSSVLNETLTPVDGAPYAGDINSNANGKVSSNPYTGQDEHRYGRGGNSKANTFLVAWIICLLLTIALSFALIADSTNGGLSGGGSSTSSADTGCLLGILWLLTFIGAIVFFILWIVALAS